MGYPPHTCPSSGRHFYSLVTLGRITHWGQGRERAMLPLFLGEFTHFLFNIGASPLVEAFVLILMGMEYS